MDDFGESLLVWFFVSSALISAVLYPLALIVVGAMLIPYIIYEVQKGQQQKYFASRIKSNPAAPVQCITELALESCMLAE